MKTTARLVRMFWYLSAGLVLITVILCLTGLRRGPRLLMTPQAALERCETMMDAVCQGDYTTASTLMYNQPDLGVDRIPSTEAARLIWDSFVESMQYSFNGPCYASDTGISQNITFTAIDIASVTANLKQRAQSQLEEQVDQADDLSLVYDEDYNYREAFVMDVLYESVRQALQEDAQTIAQDITVNLIYRDQQWWIVPDQALLSVISGGIAG